MKVYIVEGNSGEYSAYRQWPVAAFVTEVGAKRRVELAGAYARQFVTDYEAIGKATGYCPDMAKYLAEHPNPYDANMDPSEWLPHSVNYDYFEIEVSDE